MALMQSQAASLQLLDAETGEPQLIAWRGFHPDSAAHWARSSTQADTTSGAVVKNRERMIISDVEAHYASGDMGSLEHYRRSGLSAVQSTPVVSREGTPLGVISTHWAQPHYPSEHELALLDVLARQTADVLEQNRIRQELDALRTRLGA